MPFLLSFEGFWDTEVTAEFLLLMACTSVLPQRSRSSCYQGPDSAQSLLNIFRLTASGSREYAARYER